MMGQSMNLIDEEHIMILQIGQQRGKIALTLNRGCRGLAKVRPHLVRYDAGERRLSKPWRTVEKNVIKRFPARQCGLNKLGQIILYFVLPNVLAETARAQTVLPTVGTLFFE